MATISAVANMPALGLLSEDGKLQHSTEPFRRWYAGKEDLCAAAPELKRVLEGQANAAVLKLEDLSVVIAAMVDKAGVRHVLLTLPTEELPSLGDAGGALLDGALDESPALVWLKDLEGRYVRANPRFTSYLGTSEDRLLGRTDAELPPAETVDGPRVQERGGDEVEEPLQLEYFVGAFQGRDALVALRFPVVDRHGAPTLVCGVAAPTGESDLARSEAARLLRIERWSRLDADSVRAELLAEWGVLPDARGLAASPAPAADHGPQDREHQAAVAEARAERAAAIAERDSALSANEKLSLELEVTRGRIAELERAVQSGTSNEAHEQAQAELAARTEELEHALAAERRRANELERALAEVRERLSADADSARVEVERARADVEAARTQLEQTRADAAAAREEIEKARAAADKAIAAAAAERDSASSTRAALEREVQQARQHLAELERTQDTGDWQAQVFRAEKARAAAETALSEAIAERDETLKARAVLAGELEQERVQVAALRKASEAADERVRELGGDLERERVRRTEIEGSAARIHQQLEADVGTARAEAVELKAAAGKVRAELEQARGKATELEAATGNARIELAQVRAEAEVARAEAGRMQARAAELEDQLELARGRASDLQDAADQARSEAAELRAVADQARFELERAGSGSTELLAAADAARAKAEAAGAEADRAREEAEAARAQADRLDMRAGKLEIDLEHARGEAAGLAGQLEAARAQSDGLEGQLEAVRGQYDGLEAQLAAARAEAAELGAQLAAARAEAAELGAELELARSEAPELAAAVDEARAGVAELEAANQMAAAELEQVREEAVREHGRAVALEQELEQARARAEEAEEAEASAADLQRQLEDVATATPAAAAPADEVPEGAGLVGGGEGEVPPAPFPAAPFADPFATELPPPGMGLEAAGEADSGVSWQPTAKRALSASLARESVWRGVLKETVAVIGSEGGWDMVTAWLPDPADRLECAAMWSAHPSLARFQTLTSEVPVEREGSLLGQALQAPHLTWLTDIDVVDDERLQTASAHGMRSALLLPVRDGSATIGLLELLTHANIEPDAQIAFSLEASALQLGRFGHQLSLGAKPLNSGPRDS